MVEENGILRTELDEFFFMMGCISHDENIILYLMNCLFQLEPEFEDAFESEYERVRNISNWRRKVWEDVKK